MLSLPGFWWQALKALKADVEGERERSNAGAFIIHDQRRAVPVHGLPKTFGNSDSNALRRLNFERRIPLIPS